MNNQQRTKPIFLNHITGDVLKLEHIPRGISPSGCQQMIGDVWEWTSSEFTGYPGFKTGFDEYNDKWFTNQKVLRGGSFGTPKMSIRGVIGISSD